MPVEHFRGYVATVVAGLAVLGGVIAMIYLWMQPPIYHPDGTVQERDLEIIFLSIGQVVGGALTFLFVVDAQSRASHASERSFKEGRKPQAPAEPPATGEFTTTTTTETTSSTADDEQRPAPSTEPWRGSPPAVYTEADAARHMEDVR